VVVTALLFGAAVPNEFRTLRISDFALPKEKVLLTAAGSIVTHSGDYSVKTNLGTANHTFSPVDAVPNEYPSGLKIAWLMSFPNSGTSYTSKLIRHISQTSTGSNYGTENLGPRGDSIPVFPDQPEGPFWVDPTMHLEFDDPTEYVLTKTHCGGRCERCPPRKYVETTYSFRHRCLAGKWVAHDNGKNTVVYGSYPPDRVTKAIHLIRDPFDNVVSRFHLERSIKGLDHYPSTREGFR
jgi:hypothetical protein